MAATTAPAQSSAATGDIIVVDLGTEKKKHVKRLRKGKGKLMDKVQQCLEELEANNTISGSAQPVVIVVTEKGDIRSMFGEMMGN